MMVSCAIITDPGAILLVHTVYVLLVLSIGNTFYVLYYALVNALGTFYI